MEKPFQLRVQPKTGYNIQSLPIVISILFEGSELFDYSLPKFLIHRDPKGFTAMLETLAILVDQGNQGGNRSTIENLAMAEILQFVGEFHQD